MDSFCSEQKSHDNNEIGNLEFYVEQKRKMDVLQSSDELITNLTNQSYIQQEVKASCGRYAVDVVQLDVVYA